MKKKNTTAQAIKSARRKLAVQHGAYDGRFAPKVIVNKKKEDSKNACRKYRHFDFMASNQDYIVIPISIPLIFLYKSVA